MGGFALDLFGGSLRFAGLGIRVKLNAGEQPGGGLNVGIRQGAVRAGERREADGLVRNRPAPRADERAGRRHEPRTRCTTKRRRAPIRA